MLLSLATAQSEERCTGDENGSPTTSDEHSALRVETGANKPAALVSTVRA